MFVFPENLTWYFFKKKRKENPYFDMLLLGNHFKKNYIKLLAYCPGFSKYIALFSCCSCSKVFSGLKQDKSTPQQFFRSAIQTELEPRWKHLCMPSRGYKRKLVSVYSSPFRRSSIFLSFWLLLPFSKHINFHLHTYSGVHLCLIKGLLSLACKVLMLTIPL